MIGIMCTVWFINIADKTAKVSIIYTKGDNNLSTVFSGVVTESTVGERAQLELELLDSSIYQTLMRDLLFGFMPGYPSTEFFRM